MISLRNNSSVAFLCPLSCSETTIGDRFEEITLLKIAQYEFDINKRKQHPGVLLKIGMLDKIEFLQK